MNPANTTTQSQSSASIFTTSTATPTNRADPTSFKNLNTKTFTNNKVLNLNHRFVSNKVVGPDRFRYLRYYWTSNTVSR